MTLLAISAAFVGGVFLGLRLHLPASALVMFALAAVLLALLLLSFRRSTAPAALLMVLVLGMLRVASFGGEPGPGLAAYHGRGALELRGVVAADPDASGTVTRLRLAVEQVRAGSFPPAEGWVAASGDVRVTLRETAELVLQRDRPYVRYGDRLLLRGVLEAPPELEGFDYPAYLARQGIGSVMSFPNVTVLDEGEGSAFLLRLQGLRRALAGALARAVPEPQASLGQALLLGLRDNLPDVLVKRFRETGTSHLLAISGLHLGIILALGLAASQWAFGRQGQYYLIAPLVLMWLYALLAGMSPSVVRAAIMGTVYLAALALGRPRSVLPALGLAATLMIVLSPSVLHSVSFQLSFAAMGGMALLAEPIGSRLRALLGPSVEEGGERSPLLDFVAFSAAMTIAATVATLPLVAFYFQQVSLVGLPATMLALPALPLVLVTQALAGFLGLIATWLALPFGWLAWVATGYVIGVVGLFARLPGASVQTGEFGPWLVVGYYGLFPLGWYVARNIPGVGSLRDIHVRVRRITLPASDRAVPWWVLSPAIIAAALVWVAALSLPDGRLRVAFADVGQGDATLIVTPSGKAILVDGGPEPLEAARLLGEMLPFWDRTVEMVVLTHPHRDHVTGLIEVLRRYRVARILERDVDYESAGYAAWRRAVSEEGAVVTQARSGQVIAMDDGVFMEVLGPPERLSAGASSDVNNAAVVLRLVYGDFSFLLASDIFASAEAAIASRGAHLDSDILKVPHHGSRTSSSDRFLQIVSPAVAVISVGQDNRYGHPHPETVGALRRHVAGDMLFLTSESGTIEFVTDGTRLAVKTER